MKEKIESYRKGKGISKKKLAKKLDISIEDYKKIKNDTEIKGELGEKIRVLLEKKPKKRNTTIKLPSGIPDFTKNFANLNSISNHYQEMINKINNPLDKIFRLQDFKSINQPKEIGINYLRDIHNKQITGLSSLQELSKFPTSIKIATDNQLKIYKSFDSIFNDQPISLKSTIKMHENLWSNVAKPISSFDDMINSSLLETITNTVNRNEIAYEKYLDFNSELIQTLSKSAISTSTYSDLISLDNFKTKKPSVLDVLSGSTFSIINDNDDFKDDSGIINKISNTPEYKEKADSIFKEFQQIVNEETVEIVDEEKMEQLFARFYTWIVDTFSISVSKAQKVARKYFFLLPTAIAILSFINSQLTASENKENYQAIQKDLKYIQTGSKNINEKNEELLKVNKEILKLVKNQSTEQNMIALSDVNLRASRGSKSRIKSIILASQKVIVLDKKTKWMRIAYEDIKTNEPMSGWVHIKFFKESK